MRSGRRVVPISQTAEKFNNCKQVVDNLGAEREITQDGRTQPQKYEAEEKPGITGTFF